MRKVLCKENQGYEMEFKVGEEYEVEKELDTTYILINKLGNKHTVFKNHFEPVEKMEKKA